MYLEKFIPTSYKKNVLDIDYKKLKSKGIKYILFDLDNTLASVKDNCFPKEIEKLLVKLSKDFKLIVVSNNFKRRIKPICDIIDIDFISFAMKPFTLKLNKKLTKYNISKEKTCIIGDQLISDILVGNKLETMTILVDPLSTDLKVTKFNRYLEKQILKKLKLRNALERGNYYE